MNEALTPIEKRLRIAAAIVLAGLVVEALTLAWSHPLSFMFFLVPGALLLVVGVAYFLLTLVSKPAAATGAALDSDTPLPEEGKKVS
jgi:hypothetical protein